MPNTIRMKYEIPGGTIAVSVSTDEPLNSNEWTELRKAFTGIETYVTGAQATEKAAAS